MKILAITSYYPPHHTGGYEMRCREVLEGLKKRGHEVLILTNRCPTRHCNIHSNEKAIQRVLHERLNNTHLIKQILHDNSDLRLIDHEVRKFCPDIIYLWHIQNLSYAILPYFAYCQVTLVYDEGGTGLIALSRINKRGIYFYKNEHDLFIKKWGKNSICAFARLISSERIKMEWAWPEKMSLYFNSHLGLKYSEENGVRVIGACVIHPGIDVSRYPYFMRDQIQSPLYILVPGRIKPEKGTKDAIHLVLELQKRQIPARLRLVGKIQSESYFEDIQKLVYENRLEEFIEYLPMVTQDDLAHLYRESDICFFPSYFNYGLSRVPLEAMSSGCLVVTYGNEGSEEVIRNQENGYVVPEGGIAIAVDLIEGLINEPDRYQMMVHKARVTVEQEHALDQYIDSIEEYLLESMGKKN